MNQLRMSRKIKIVCSVMGSFHIGISEEHNICSFHLIFHKAFQYILTEDLGNGLYSNRHGKVMMVK